MKEHEIEKLREKLGDEYSVKRQNGAITVELVDIWKGVEFAEVICESNGLVTNGKIYRIFELSIENLFIVNDKGQEFGVLNKSSAKPSTESAYVEQLKSKAYELYGDIKDGDRFWIDENLGEVLMYDCEDGFSYWKEEDLLYFGNYAIYSKGKWAKKVEEPIKVNISGFTLSNPYSTITFTTSHLIKSLDSSEFANHIEEAIEAYLNKQ